MRSEEQRQVYMLRLMVCAPQPCRYVLPLPCVLIIPSTSFFLNTWSPSLLFLGYLLSYICDCGSLFNFTFFPLSLCSCSPTSYEPWLVKSQENRNLFISYLLFNMAETHEPSLHHYCIEQLTDSNWMLWSRWIIAVAEELKVIQYIKGDEKKHPTTSLGATTGEAKSTSTTMATSSDPIAKWETGQIKVQNLLLLSVTP